MRKTKAVKAICILLSVMLMLCTLTVHSTAAPVFASIPQEAAAAPREVHELNEAARHLETTSALDEAGVTYTICEAGYIWIPFTEEPLCWSILGPSDEELAASIFVFDEPVYDNKPMAFPEDETIMMYDPANGIWVEAAVGTFDGWHFYMFYDTEVGLYFVPDFGLHFDPAIPMFYAAHIDLWLENHTIACASESVEICSSYWLNSGEIAEETYGETIWADSDEEYYYISYGRLRNLADYLNNPEYRMFRLFGVTLEEFLVSGMAGGMHRAFSGSGVAGGITREQFEAFYATGIWQETYEAVRAFDMDLDEYETMLARSGLTLSEWVAGLMVSGSALSDIQTSLEFQLTLDLRSHGVSFAWDGVVDEEEIQEFYGIVPFSANWPQMTLLPIASGGIRHNEVALTGRIGNMSVSPITMHGFWVTGGSLGSRHGERHYAPQNATYTHVVTGLAPNTAYTVRAVARNVASGSNTGQSPNPAGTFRTNITSPSHPQNLRVDTSRGIGQVHLTWSAPRCTGGVNITRYEVRLNNGNWTQPDGIASHTFRDLPAGNHTFSVRAINSSSFLGEVASITASARFNMPTVAGTLISTTHNSATLTGRILSTGGALITFRGSWHSLTTPGARHTERSAHHVSENFTVTINNLTPNTAYVSRAVARNNGNSGTGQSGVIDFRTNSPPTTPPSAPQNFGVTSLAPGQARLTWSAPSSNGGAVITSYQVSSDNGVSWRQATSATEHVFTGLPSGQRTFRVRAVNSAGSGAYASRQINVMAQPATPPTAPQNFNVTSLVPGQANLTWAAPSSNGGAAITGYQVSNNNGTTWVVAQSATGHVFTGLPSGQRTFRVRAVNSAGSGTEASRQITVMAQPQPTATIQYTGGGHTTGSPPASRVVNVPGNVVLAQLGNMLRTGYTFNGWRRNNVIIQAGQNFWAATASGTYTFEAAWVRNTVTLTFNANGGTPATQPITRVPGLGNTIGTLPPNPTRTNHRFLGWYTESSPIDGLRVNSNTTVPNVNTTYFARWESTVTFHPNGGEFYFGASAWAYDIGDEGWIYSREDYIGREEFHNIIDGMFGDNEHFIAGEELLPMPMSTTPMTRHVVSGTAVGPLPQNLRQANHTFWDWSTDPGGMSPITDARIIDGDTHLFAQYRRNPAITNPAVERQTVLMASLPVRWETISGATHRLTLRDVTTGTPITLINSQIVSGGSFTIPVSHFAVGRWYQVEIMATVSGRNLISRRIFTVGQILPTITRPATNGQAVPFENLDVEWSGISGATYQLTLVNTTTGAVSSFTGISGTSFRIPVRYLTAGHGFRVEVAATLNGQTVSSARTFTVLQPVAPPSAGITVTVLDNTGLPLSGATVQFVHRTGSRNFHITDANGTVFLPNAAAGRWGINVTHPNFASTFYTSTPYVMDGNTRVPNLNRSSSNQVDNVSFTMREPISRFRSLKWDDVLEDMCTHPYRISSVYAWRYDGGWGWHAGIDIAETTSGDIAGKEVFSAFRGYVVDTFSELGREPGRRGHGVVMRLDDWDNNTFFFLEYMHMQQAPLVSRCLIETIPAGTHIGYVGNTGNSFGYHLHIDVHWRNTPEYRRDRRRTIDPRAFFAPDFVLPW